MDEASGGSTVAASGMSMTFMTDVDTGDDGLREQLRVAHEDLASARSRLAAAEERARIGERAALDRMAEADHLRSQLGKRTEQLYAEIGRHERVEKALAEEKAKLLAAAFSDVEEDRFRALTGYVQDVKASMMERLVEIKGDVAEAQAAAHEDGPYIVGEAAATAALRAKLEAERTELHERMTRAVETARQEARRDVESRVSAVQERCRSVVERFQRKLEQLEARQRPAQLSIVDRDVRGSLHMRDVYRGRDLDRSRERRGRVGAVTAPVGRAAIVLMHVTGAAELWMEDADVMCAALDVANDLIRRLADQFRGFEAVPHGDAVMLAFATATSAVQFAAAFGAQLASAVWPSVVLEHEKLGRSRVVATAGGGTRMVARGLHYALGVHFGPVTTGPSERYGKEYTGRTIHVASHVAAAAHEDQVLVTQSLIDTVRAETGATAVTVPHVGVVTVRTVGLHRIVGLGDPVGLGEYGTSGFPEPDTATAALGRIRAELERLEAKRERLVEGQGLTKRKFNADIYAGLVAKVERDMEAARDQLAVVESGLDEHPTVDVKSGAFATFDRAVDVLKRHAGDGLMTPDERDFLAAAEAEFVRTSELRGTEAELDAAHVAAVAERAAVQAADEARADAVREGEARVQDLLVENARLAESSHDAGSRAGELQVENEGLVKRVRDAEATSEQLRARIGELEEEVAAARSDRQLVGELVQIPPSPRVQGHDRAAIEEAQFIQWTFSGNRDVRRGFQADAKAKMLRAPHVVLDGELRQAQTSVSLLRLAVRLVAQRQIELATGRRRGMDDDDDDDDGADGGALVLSERQRVGLSRLITRRVQRIAGHLQLVKDRIVDERRRNRSVAVRTVEALMPATPCLPSVRVDKSAAVADLTATMRFGLSGARKTVVGGTLGGGTVHASPTVGRNALSGTMPPIRAPPASARSRTVQPSPRPITFRRMSKSGAKQ